MVLRYLAPLLFAACSAAGAQTLYIPDLFLRECLNDAKPNVVDANGQCDTALWNAAPPYATTVDFDMTTPGSTVDLEGIQYLKIPYLMIRDGTANNVSITWPGHPLNGNILALHNTAYSSITGPLLPMPLTLGAFQCYDCDIDFLPDFNGTHLVLQDGDLGGQWLTVPPSVTFLWLVNCNITDLPIAPNVQSLLVDDNPLADWDNLPAGLIGLSANNVGLNYLPPALPPNLQTLDVSGNAITALPTLPNYLQRLTARNNMLTTLPTLPAGLGTLYIDNNPLGSLPALPAYLEVLGARNCGLSTLPAWAPGMETILLDSNSFSVLPPLPATLLSLDVRECTALTCLPPLPPDMYWTKVGGSGISCLPNIPPDMYLGLEVLGIDPVVCSAGNSPCPLSDPLVTGTTFTDADGDGVMDAGEVTRANALVIAQPGDLLTASDMNGDYVLPANIGSYTVEGVPGLYEPVTTAPYAVNFGTLGEVDSLNHIGYQLVPGMYDLVTTITATQVRPGFNTNVWVHVQNVGTEPTTATVQLIFDPALTYNTSNEVPTSVNGNVVEWSLGSLTPGAAWGVSTSLYGPPSLVLGTAVVQQATATPAQLDQTPGDNTYVLNDVVVGSYDPNDKRVEPELLSLTDVASGTRVHYTVRFQNTGTFPAERVLITDTLSDRLQWATMRLEAASHVHRWYIHNGVLHVLFDHIDLPDSTSDEAGSHGSVKFSFVPAANLLVGDQVDNIANIYFDYNEPVITNTATVFVNTTTALVESGHDGLLLWPNPAKDILMLKSPVAMKGTLDVVDVSGRTVLRQVATGTQAIVPLGALRAGSYLLRYTTVEGAHSARFVKQ